jgi:hypothetical protein
MAKAEREATVIAMTKNAVQITSVSALMGVPVADATGRIAGHVREFAVSPAVDANHVQGLVLRPLGSGRGGRMVIVAVSDLEISAAGGLRLHSQGIPTQLPPP